MEDIKLVKKYLGVVVDNRDPIKIGRCKIRIDWLHGSIPTKDLPWANPKHPIFFGMGGQAGSISIPKKNAIVEVRFNDGDQYAPEYSLMQELADDVKEELLKEYDGTHILGFDGDEGLKMYYTRTKGLTFFLNDSRINISPDQSITIEHAETSSIIELRGGTITINSDSQVNVTAGTRIKNSSQEVWADGRITKLGHQPQYSAMLGEPMFLLLKLMAQTIDAKLYPTPGLIATAVEQMKKLILSETVKVSK